MKARTEKVMCVFYILATLSRISPAQLPEKFTDLGMKLQTLL